MSFNWDSIKSFIGKFAPTVAAAIGGPFGGAAVGLACRALGLSEETPEALQKAMEEGTLKPEQIVALRASEQQFKKDMATIGITGIKDLENIAATDRASARERESKTGDSWTPRILAGIVVVSWMAVTFILIRHIVPPEAIPIVMRMLGTLDAALMLVLSYYFGSSAGSDLKTRIMAMASGEKSNEKENPQA